MSRSSWVDGSLSMVVWVNEDDGGDCRCTARRSEANCFARGDISARADRRRPSKGRRGAKASAPVSSATRHIQGQGTASRCRSGRMGVDSRALVQRSRSLIAIDTNLLVYAHPEDSPWHAQPYTLPPPPPV